MKKNGRDYLLLHGARPHLNECVKLADKATPLEQVVLDSDQVAIHCSNGSIIKGTIQSYHFGDVAESSAPGGQFPERGGSIAVLRVLITDVHAGISDAVMERLHMVPPPHFLDSDWRFTERTARVIVEYCRSQARDGQICYLGCPTLALWHAKRYPNETGWLLLDKGHVALRNWVGKLIASGHFLSFDVLSPLPSDLKGRFAAVITDPPWYEREYTAFWQQAQTLVAPNGVIGVTYYPPFLDEEKYRRFQYLMRSEYALFGSTEIDYEVPEFESASGLESQFIHPESGIYRQGYMDFYGAPAKKKDVVVTRYAKREHGLASVEMLGDGHFMYCRDSVANDATYPLRITVRRRGLEHATAIPTSCIGWTTRNLLVSVSTNPVDQEVSSRDELLKYVARKDKDPRLKAE